MDRRRFLLASLAGALAAPVGVQAQLPEKARRIGILGNVPLNDSYGALLWGAFTQGLRELGYVDGQNVSIEHVSSEGKYERLADLAAGVVRRNPDVIVVPADQNALAVKHATQTIPIVMIGDPVGSGLVASHARPGGNITGVSTVAGGYEIVGKRLELLKEVAPRASRIAVLSNPGNPSHALGLNEVETAARSLNVQLHALQTRHPDDFEKAFAAMTNERADAVLILGDGMFGLHRNRLADLALKRRLPTLHAAAPMVIAGGFMSYGASGPEAFRRAAMYVDRILKGAKPADLPVEQPTKFELVINLKTAKAIGLTIPPSLLVRADQVIE
jgi:putative ABC transport system substrate-binding protein